MLTNPSMTLHFESGRQSPAEGLLLHSPRAAAGHGVRSCNAALPFLALCMGVPCCRTQLSRMIHTIRIICSVRHCRAWS